MDDSGALQEDQRDGRDDDADQQDAQDGSDPNPTGATAIPAAELGWGDGGDRRQAVRALLADGEGADPGSQVYRIGAFAQEAVGSGARPDADQCAGLGMGEVSMGGQMIHRLRRRHLGHQHRSRGGTFHRADPPIGNDPTAPRLYSMGNHRPPRQEPGRFASAPDHADAEVVDYHGVDTGGVVAVRVEEEQAGHGQRLRSRPVVLERSVAQLSGGTGAGVTVGSGGAWRRAADGSRC